MPQLDPTWFASQLFWLFLCFTLLYTLLARVVLPPILAIVGQREQSVAGDLAQAEAFRASAASAKQNYEQALAQSREMSQNLIAEVLQENKQRAVTREQRLAEQTSAQITDAKVRIHTRKQELLTSLTPMAAEFATMIADKVLRQPTSPDVASRAVLSVIKERT